MDSGTGAGGRDRPSRRLALASILLAIALGGQTTAASAAPHRASASTPPHTAAASTFVVTSTADIAGTCAPSGPCTLRQAIASAQTGDTVAVAAGTYKLTAGAGGTITIPNGIIIAGTPNAASSTIIDGQGATRLFIVAGGQTVTFRDLTLTGGYATDAGGGGAIQGQLATTLDLTRVVLDHDSETQAGGGIYENNDTVNLTDVTFSNDGAAQGGGLYAYGGTVTGSGVLFAGNGATGAGGGGIYANGASLTLTNASFAANTAPAGSGGGLFIDDSTTTLTNDTLAGDNSAGAPQGGNDLFTNTAGAIAATNTIFDSGQSGTACAGYAFGPMSNDIVADASCTSPIATAVQSATDPRLMPLGTYGGPTATVGILPSSPAIGAAAQGSCPAQDARGFSRASGCDIGAVQRQPGDPAPPYAHTDPATSVWQTSATLNATVNPSGANTTYYFQYGPAGTFSMSSTPVQLPNDSSDHAVTTTVGGLSPSTQYQYRVIASNAAGTATAYTGTFTTQANQAPTCASTSVSVAAGGSVALPLSCSDADGDQLTLSITGQPAHGTLGQIDQTAGSVSYTAQSGYGGSDSVSFVATDPYGASSPPATVTVTVSGSSGGGGGGTSGGGGGPTPPPGCSQALSFGVIDAHGCFSQHGSQYITTTTATVNGITITPDPGATLVLDSATGAISTTGGGAGIWLGSIEFNDGSISWLTPATAPPNGAQVAQFDPNVKVLIAGFPIAGHVTVNLVKGGATFQVALRLPDVFNGVTGQTTLQTSESGGFRLDSIQLQADDLPLGAVHLDNVLLSYDATTDTWQGGATVYLPTPYQLGIIGGLSLQGGQFQSATAGVDNLNVPLADGIYLQRIQLSLAVNPLDIGGGISLSVGPVMPISATPQPGSAPKPGEELVRIDGNLDWRFSNPWRLHVDGSVKLVDANLASAYFDYLSSGSMDFGGKIELGLPDTTDPDHQPIYFAATLNGWVDGSRAFDAEAGALLRVLDVNVASAQLLVSNLGVAGCGQIGWLYGGFGYTWSDGMLALMGPYSCDIGPYRPAPPTIAAAHARTLSFAPGTGTEIIKITGATAPPQLTLVGPRGQRVTTRSDGGPVLTPRFVVLTYPKANTTYIAIRHAAGDWRLLLDKGSTIRSLSMAATLPRPRIRARVLGRGRVHQLHYSVSAPRGDRVEFVEIGRATHRVLATVVPGTGVVRFTPGRGPGGRRRIVAIVIAHGLTQSQQDVTAYVASGPAHPTRPRGVRASRQRAALVVSWRPVTGADGGYLLRVAVRDGATRVLAVGPRRTRLQIRGLLATDSGVVTVAGIGQDGSQGPASPVRFSPAHHGR